MALLLCDIETKPFCDFCAKHFPQLTKELPAASFAFAEKPFWVLL
jgi:hypothetical protein